MLEVQVSLGKAPNVRATTVYLYSYNRLTPKAARTAIKIVGGFTGEVWYYPPNPGNDAMAYAQGYGYRVYPNSTRKLYGWQR